MTRRNGFDWQVIYRSVYSRANRLGIASFALALYLVSAGALLADKPFITDYPNQVAIANVPFAGVQPGVKSEISTPSWSLFGAPNGMTINSATGITSWTTPVIGNYRIHLHAESGSAQDELVWHLLVVDQFANQRMVSTKYVDFIVSNEMADWMDLWQPQQLVDGGWEYMRDLIGQEPYQGRQALILDPGMGGGAGSGNPIRMGPDWWSNDPVQGWYIFTTLWVHEQGHNFNALMRAPEGQDWPDFDPYVHHMCEFQQESFIAAVLASPERYGLSGEQLDNYRLYAQWLKDEYTRRYGAYSDWVSSGGTPAAYTGDKYGVWQKILDTLADQYGIEVLRNTLRAYRPEGMSTALRKAADTQTKRISLLVAVMSATAGHDLQTSFTQWGWPVDQPFYDSVKPEVTSVVANLQPTVFTPWRYSALRGHYYGLTSVELNWPDAELTARRAGGHLMTIRSAAEMDWMKATFGPRPFFLGGFDATHEGTWTWSSGDPFTYTQGWMIGEPNGGTNENYLASNWWDLEGWIDVDLNARFQGIIEIPRLNTANPKYWLAY